MGSHPGSIFDSKGPPLGQKCEIFDPKVIGPNHGRNTLGSILGPIGLKKWGLTQVLTEMEICRNFRKIQFIRNFD